jgi:hypothetical protein
VQSFNEKLFAWEFEHFLEYGVAVPAALYGRERTGKGQAICGSAALTEGVFRRIGRQDPAHPSRPQDVPRRTAAGRNGAESRRRSGLERPASLRRGQAGHRSPRARQPPRCAGTSPGNRHPVREPDAGDRPVSPDRRRGHGAAGSIQGGLGPGAGLGSAASCRGSAPGRRWQTSEVFSRHEPGFTQTLATWQRLAARAKPRRSPVVPADRHRQPAAARRARPRRSSSEQAAVRKGPRAGRAAGGSAGG